MTRVDPSRAVWRKSSRSPANGGTQDCVEVATLDDDRIAVRDSKHPNGAVLFLSRTQLATSTTRPAEQTFGLHRLPRPAPRACTAPPADSDPCAGY